MNAQSVLPSCPLTAADRPPPPVPPARPDASSRPSGWLARHPLFVLVPALIVAGMIRWGAVPVGLVLGGLAAAVLIWWRAHPATFDRFAAPRLRSSWRRWTAYRGSRWRAAAG